MCTAVVPDCSLLQLHECACTGLSPHHSPIAFHTLSDVVFHGPCFLCCCSSPSLQDIVESPGAFTVRADAPGFDPQDVNIQLKDGMITISGRKNEDKKQEQGGKVSACVLQHQTLWSVSSRLSVDSLRRVAQCDLM